MTESRGSESSDGFDIENATEVVRQFEINELLKKAMGEPFPERPNLDSVSRILDIGCGPGGWAVDVARKYPRIKVVGIDISKAMIDYARSEAQKYHLKNVRFLQMDALQPLKFRPQRFHLVNMRAAVEYVPRATWPTLLQECYRVTQPGGILRITGADRLWLTNSNAFEQYHLLYVQMLHHTGYGFSPDGYTFGITPMLGQLLHNAGYRNTSMKSYMLDLSQKDCWRLLQLRFEKVRRQLLEKKFVAENTLEEIHFDSLKSIGQPAFCGVAYPLIFWGQK